MEQRLDNYCYKLAVVLYSRYYCDTSDINVDVIEVLDNEVLKLFESMFNEFQIKDDVGIFRHFFWSRMNVCTEWQKAISDFGKDFSYIKDYINDIFDDFRSFKNENHQN